MGYSLDDIDEGITLAGCDTDPDNVKCIGLWAERTFINEEIEYYGCRVGMSSSVVFSASSVRTGTMATFVFLKKRSVLKLEEVPPPPPVLMVRNSVMEIVRLLLVSGKASQ